MAMASPRHKKRVSATTVAGSQLPSSWLFSSEIELRLSPVYRATVSSSTPSRSMFAAASIRPCSLPSSRPCSTNPCLIPAIRTIRFSYSYDSCLDSLKVASQTVLESRRHPCRNDSGHSTGHFECAENLACSNWNRAPTARTQRHRTTVRRR